MTNPEIYIANEKGAIALTETFLKTITIECEYGDSCIEGSILTLAHHGARFNNLCPCLKDNEKIECDAIIVSHVDLDTIGGIMAVLGIKPENELFWDLAAYVDLNGPHKIKNFQCPWSVKRFLYAFYAYSRDNKIYLEKDKDFQKIDLSKYFEILEILITDKNKKERESFLKLGDEFKKNEDELNLSSFCEHHYINNDTKVCVRVSNSFVNFLYNGPYGTIHQYVIAFNPKTGSITLSSEDGNSGILSCSDIMVKVFGSEAGGHRGIAGSPRNQRQKLNKIYDIIEEMKKFFNY